MKKRFAVLTVLLAMTMGMTVSAAEPTAQSKDVKAKYIEAAAADTVYSLNVDFGAMDFEYVEASEGTWNPETHAFVDKTAAYWNYKNGNKITVTNHSNAALKLALSFASDVEAISGSFGKDNVINLATAVGTAVDAAPTKTAELTLEGALPKSTNVSSKIGSVTVTVQK